MGSVFGGVLGIGKVTGVVYFYTSMVLEGYAFFFFCE